jgi:putative heme-binding domain-containing protein
MSARHGMSYAAFAGLLILSLARISAAMPIQENDASAAVRAQVEAGKQLFATSCANCHGSGGTGAIGPGLADRGLAEQLIRTTFLNGRFGTPMPSFKDDLDAKSQAQIIAYVIWITSAGRLPTDVVSSEPSAGSSASATEPSTQPIAVGAGHGIPAHGGALFFDPAQVRSCRTCHSYANKGGPVGPDLNNSDRTPLEIYERITRPNVASPSFPAVAVELRDGGRFVGVKSEESDATIRIYDVSSTPPVKRTILKSEIARISAVSGAGIYDHTALPYSKQDRLDLAAYLGQKGGATGSK